MEFKITRAEVLTALHTEVDNLKPNEFFHAEETRNNNYYGETLEFRYPYPDQMLNCKVCAVGAVLRHCFSITEIMRNNLITKSVGDDYVEEAYFEVVDNFKDIDDYYEQLVRSKTVGGQLDKYPLASLSVFFESIIKIHDEFKTDMSILDYLKKFVRENFPHEITIEV